MRPATRDALLFAAAAVAIACLLPAEPPIHSDTARDLLWARDLREAAAAPTEGVSTSLAGLHQGMGYIHLLAALQTLGLAPAAMLRLLFVACALAACAAFADVRRVAPLPRAVLAGAVTLAGLLWATEFPILWNPLLAPLPLVAAALATVALARGAGPGTALFGAIAAAIAAEGHVAYLVIAAPLALAASLGAERPLAAIPIAAAGPFVFFAAGFSTAAFDGALSAAGLLAWIAALALALACLATIAARSRFQRLDPLARDRWARIAALAFVVALHAAALGWLGRTAMGPRYWQVCVPFLGLAIGAAPPLPQRIPATIAAILATLAMIAFALAHAAPDGLRFSDASEIAAVAKEAGIERAALFYALRADDEMALASSTAALGALPGVPSERRTLAVIPARRARPWPADAWIPLRSGRARVLPGTTAIDVTHARLCLDGPRDCIDVAPSDFPRNLASGEAQAAAYPSLRPMRRHLDQHHGPVWVRFPLIPTAGAIRQAASLDPACRFHGIERDGAIAEQPDGADFIDFAPTRDTAIWLVCDAPAHVGPTRQRDWPPPLIDRPKPG